MTPSSLAARRRLRRRRSRPGRPPPPASPARCGLRPGRCMRQRRGQAGSSSRCRPDMLGTVGPMFAPINPQNAQSTGFSAGNFGSGAMGAISGITVVMSAQLAAGTMFVASTAAAEVYEDRVGTLQVVEPQRARLAGQLRRLLRAAGHLGDRHPEDREDAVTDLRRPEPGSARARPGMGGRHRRRRRGPQPTASEAGEKTVDLRSHAGLDAARGRPGPCVVKRRADGVGEARRSWASDVRDRRRAGVRCSGSSVRPSCSSRRWSGVWMRRRRRSTGSSNTPQRAPAPSPPPALVVSRQPRPGRRALAAGPVTVRGARHRCRDRDRDGQGHLVSACAQAGVVEGA